MNAGIEHTMGVSAPRDWLVRSTLRHAWFAEEGDVYLTPAGISADELGYMARVLELDRSCVKVVNNESVVTDECLRSEALISVLRDQVDQMHGWSVFPCFYTAGVADLVQRLGLPDPGGLGFASDRGLDLLNRKSHFRALMAGADLPVAEGTVAETPMSLAAALTALLGRTGTVIVKRDDGAGGLGNVTVTTEATAILQPGASSAFRAEGDMRWLAERLWANLTDEWSRVLVVEAYYPATHRFYCEFRVGEHGAATLLHMGTIRGEHDRVSPPDSPWKLGLEIPAELPSHIFGAAAALATQVATLAGSLGYRGLLNIDAVATADDRILFSEINARWGGGTILDALARRLLGNEWTASHAVSSLRGLPARDSGSLIEELRVRNLHFDRGSNHGVIVLACDDRRSPTMECMVIGGSRAHVRRLEDDFLHMLGAPQAWGHGGTVPEAGTLVTRRQWKLLPAGESPRTASDR